VFWKTFAASLLPVLAATCADAASLYRDGASARSMALGGSMTAVADGPQDALLGNPAALSEIHRATLELTAGGGFLHGDFANRANRDNVLNDAGAFGAGAVAVPVGPVCLALGFNPDMALRDRWRYRDAPGGADGGTTYGLQAQESEIILLRTSLGLSWEIVPNLSIGGSVGLLYNRNELHAPYVFQSQHVLQTAKVLLNLETGGYGWNYEGGISWKPVPAVRLGASYTSSARIVSDGRAGGNAGVQFANLGLGAARPDFAYDATVINVFPQQVTGGISWEVTSKLTLTAQLDWMNWSNSFRTLRVRLKDGNNEAINGLLHSTSLNDDVPLDWRDQFVERFGIEFALDSHWTLRAGYFHANNPVPTGTLTPLTAAITENTLTAGIGFQSGRFKVDGAYQWGIPNTVQVGQSALASGEYSHSSVRISEQWVGLTATVQF
jgi:long-subunit fatty acid transport protein